MTTLGVYSRPTLIIEKQTGVKYTNQVGGCACFHPEIEGFILPYKVDESTVYFDPKWWSEQYGYCKSAIMRFVNNPENKGKTFSFNEVDTLFRNGSANGIGDDLRQWYYWKWFCDFVEEEFEGIHLKVKQDCRQIEAWIAIRCEYGDGILTWENCD